ncbi:MAG: FAD-dependent oxidoreductase [Candidatus Omnitrophica bacterium]|nr:FAD-dependent oxidoreductase [Candidatus Omnitrophota bacterium]
MSLAGLAGVQIFQPSQTPAKPGEIVEPARAIPVCDECDICVLGGSCTGVFAAVRAARLGAKVVLIEKQNSFGGTATNSLVNVWHSYKDEAFEKDILAGLTIEMMERLKKRSACKEYPRSGSRGFEFNSEELKIELDELAAQAKIKPYLHTMFSQPVVDGGELKAVIVENKSGRSAIKAKFFIDATGDGDLCARLNVPSYARAALQPPTACARFARWKSLQGINLNQLIAEHRSEFDLPEGFMWGSYVPDSDVYMLAGTRIYDVNCAEAGDLTAAEMEGRRQIRAIQDILRKYAPESNITLQALPSHIGLRETRHIRCQYQLKDDDVLYGRRFDDAVANGSYRIDVHHQDKPGITLKYLDGRMDYIRPDAPRESGRWREKNEVNPTYYQIPFRSLIPQGPYGNVIIAGRMLDAETEAFSAVRVMVNMNQTGEAAGVAAWLALNADQRIEQVDPRLLRSELEKGGSIVL